jgi:hypothetical protein
MYVCSIQVKQVEVCGKLILNKQFHFSGQVQTMPINGEQNNYQDWAVK